MSCEQCRQQLLPFLYDLLDPLEREATAAHIERCPECQAALAQAREQQGLLAEAVKQEHTDIVFKAPTKATPASTAPTLVMEPVRRRRRFLLNRWAAAAAILLILFTGGSVIGWSAWREQSRAHADANDRLAEAKKDLAKSENELINKKGQTQKEIRAIQDEIDQLFGTWKKAEIKTRKLENKEGASLTIKGPQSPIAGANNNYEVAFKQDAQKDAPPRMQKAPESQRMQVRVFNTKTNETLLNQKVPVQEANDAQIANFAIPANLAIKPGDPIALEFEAEMPDGKLIKLTDNLNLIFPEYVTHLATDRPLYRPGDTVRFRSLTLERFSLKPALEKFHLRYRIVGPEGEEFYNRESASVVVGADQKPLKGPGGEELSCFGVGEFALPATVPDGQYTLSVVEVNERFNEEKRTFQVLRNQPARYSKEIEFDRTSYVGGDNIKVKVRIVPVQPWQDAGRGIQVAARLNVDGVKADNPGGAVDPDGRFTFDFALPNPIPRGVGTVTVECTDGIIQEKAVRSLPLVVRDVQVDFFPEGGDLIAGVPNRVYFQARTPAGKPSHLEGRIVDDKNNEVAYAWTLSDDKESAVNLGLGVFTFVPEPRKRYKLMVDTPIGIDRPLHLPEVKDQGVVMTIPQGVSDGEIGVELLSVKERRELLVGAYCRGRMLDHKVVRAGANQPVSVMLRPNPGVGGVYRITVFETTRNGDEYALKPLAERLVYRKGSEKVDVAITSDHPRYHAGDKVRLSLETRNEKKEATPAISMLAVVNGNTLKLADDKTSRGMPTHFLLTSELRNPEDLENADVLLGDHPQSAAALDLLLGCQGWRRFAEQKPQEFQRANRGQQVNANWLTNTAVVTQFFETDQKQVEKLDQAYVTKAIELQKKLGQTESAEDGPVDVQKVVIQQQNAVEMAGGEVDLANSRLRQVRAFLVQFALGGVLLALLFVCFYLVSVGLRRLCETDGNARPWFTAGLGLFVLLFLVSVIGTFALMGERLMEDLHGRDRKWAPAPAFGPGMGGAPLVNLAPAGPNDIVVEDAAEPDDMLNPVVADQKDKNAIVQPNAAIRNTLRQEQFQNEQNVRNNILFNARNNEVVNVKNDDADDRQLRKEGNYQALLLKHLGRRVQLPAVNDPCVVREYAHRYNPPAGRPDNAETIYWHPVLVMPDGKADVQFDLSDAVTRFQVLVHTNTFDGRQGTSRVDIVSALPFAITPTTPDEVSNNDQLVIPVKVQNDRAKQGAGMLSLRGKGIQPAENPDRDVNLAELQPKRELFHVNPSIVEGEASIRLIGKTERNVDSIERRIKVTLDGIPATGSFSGVLDNGSIRHDITLPADWIAGTLQVKAHFYPSPPAEVQGALDDLARQPTVGVEQALASRLPNATLLHFMQKQTTYANPIVEKRARYSLQAGVEYSAKTMHVDEPYGLWQLNELAKLLPVETETLERGTQSLLDQRDGGGGFKRKIKDANADAISVWALTELDAQEDLSKELTSLHGQAKNSKDPRFLALVALSHLNRKQSLEAIALLRQITQFQKGTGVVVSIDPGRESNIETTALAILAWLKADQPGEFATNILSGVKWLGQQRHGAGSYGSARTTAIALRAMMGHHAKNPSDAKNGEVTLTVRHAEDAPGGPPIEGLRAAYSVHAPDPVTLSWREVKMLRPGKNVVELAVVGNAAIPYTLTWSCRVEKPANDPAAPIKLSAKLSQFEAIEGAKIKLHATIENVSGKAQGTAIAVIGLPAGVSVADADLKALAAAGKIAAWEVRGRELVLSWHSLPKSARHEIEVGATCTLPGSYRGPASRAYLQRGADQAFFVSPLSIRVAAGR